MFGWLFKIKNWDWSTAVFATVLILFASPIILGAIYSYVRLDFNRSHPTTLQSYKQ